MMMSTLSNQQQQQQKQQVLIIAGPTGVGKSSVAAILCSQLNGMIVSADSVQTYRGVQIGANKPTQQEREQSPHFLIDVVDARETYNAADWREDALFVIDQLAQNVTVEDSTNHRDTTPTTIRILSKRQQALQEEIMAARSRDHPLNNNTILPIVVGGTMMYLEWLVHGIPDAAKPSAASLTRALETIASFHDDFDAAATYVSSLDPAIATRVQTLCGKDWYRLRRILEIAYTAMEDSTTTTTTTTATNPPTSSTSCEDTSGRKRKVTEGNSAPAPLLFTGVREGSLDDLGYDVRCFFLCPTDRMQHTALVDARCEQMLIGGLIPETTDLFLDQALPEMATRAIGYRQVLEYLQRTDPKPNDYVALDQLIHDFTTATRRYAKKQMQWFRKSAPEFLFVPVDLQRTDRVKETAQTIAHLAGMSREEFDRQWLPSPLTTTDDDDDPSCQSRRWISQSEQTKRSNEEQGKKMKYYTPNRYLLKKDSKEYAEILRQADDCTQRMKEAAKPNPT